MPDSPGASGQRFVNLVGIFGGQEVQLGALARTQTGTPDVLCAYAALEKPHVVPVRGEECTVVGIFFDFFLSFPCPFPSSDQQDQHQSRPRRGVIIPPPDWPDWARAGRAG